MRRLVLLGFIWGWSFLFIKVGVEGLTPPTVAWARVALGAVVLRAWLRATGVPSLPAGPTRRWAAAVGAVASAVPFTLLAWGEERITSALTAVLNASTPLFTAIAAAAIVGERIRAAQVAGLVLGFVGVAAAAGLGVSDLSGSSLAGVAAAVAAGACYGVGFSWMRAHLTGVPPAVAAAGQLTAAAILLTPFALATSLADGVELSWRRAGAIVLLGVVGTGLAYLLNYRVVADLGATRASLVTYVVPVVAVTVGVVVLDEPFEIGLVVGGALIVAGIALVNGNVQLPRRPPVAAAGVVALLALATLPACGDGGEGGGSACGPVRREALDPQSAVHVLGGDEPEYATDPPTSGPHQPGEPLSGVLDEPVPRPVQVGHLEAGGVLIQHRGDLDPEQLAGLRSLAGERVAVAPNPDLPDPVVATAWLFKQRCDAVDVEALRRFVDDHLGRGAGFHG